MPNILTVSIEAGGSQRTRDEIVRELQDIQKKASELSAEYNRLAKSSIDAAEATQKQSQMVSRIKSELKDETDRVKALTQALQAEEEHLNQLTQAAIKLNQAQKTRTGIGASPASGFAGAQLRQNIEETTGKIKDYQSQINLTNDHIATLNSLHKDASATLKEHNVAQQNVNTEKKRAAQAYSEVNSSIRQTKAELRDHDKVQQEAERSANKLTASQLALANMIGYALYNAIRNIVSTMGNFIKDAVIYASRTDEMRIALENMGRVTGHTSAELAAHEKAIVSLNITTQQARETLTKFMLADIELGKASQLARVAQDLAVIVGVDTSEELERLTRGISTLQVRTLRTAGVFVNLADAEKDVARQTGRSVDSFSEAEKQTILLNQVLDFGARASGTYAESLENAGKRMRSMNRIFAEMQNAIGGLFQGEFANLIDAISFLMKLITQAPKLVLGVIAVFGTLGASIAINVLATTSWGKSLDNLIVKLGAATKSALGFAGASGAAAGAQ